MDNLMSERAICFYDEKQFLFKTIFNLSGDNFFYEKENAFYMISEGSTTIVNLEYVSMFHIKLCRDLLKKEPYTHENRILFKNNDLHDPFIIRTRSSPYILLNEKDEEFVEEFLSADDGIWINKSMFRVIEIVKIAETEEAE